MLARLLRSEPRWWRTADIANELDLTGTSAWSTLRNLVLDGTVERRRAPDRLDVWEWRARTAAEGAVDTCVQCRALLAEDNAGVIYCPDCGRVEEVWAEERQGVLI